MRLSLVRFLLASLLGSTFVVRADFHVSTLGTDVNPGTASRPFATLERARDAIRELKAQRGLPKGGLTVWIHEGD
jgi:hypothetical protein